MKRVIWLAASVTLIFAGAARAEGRKWLVPDFFVDHEATLYARPVWARPSDCRAQIGRALCVVRERFDRHNPHQARRCDLNNAKYRAFFEAVYDRFPAPLQKMFCSVSSLRVEPDLESIAYAGMRGAGAVVGMRKSVIDENLSLSSVLSWKEQLPFGGTRDDYQLADDLPQYTITSNASAAEDLAFYVLAHEFGHLFDFANELNGGCFPGADCEAEPGSWTALSWESTLQPKPDFDFKGRDRVCFYNCDGAPLSAADVEPVYRGLHQTGFVTLYAATNVYDDLAESLAFLLLEGDGHFTFALDTHQGSRYDLLAKVHASSFSPKRRYLERFLQSGQAAYP